MLCQLSYTRKRVAGLEPAPVGSKKEPLPAHQADSTVKGRDNCIDIAELRGQGSNPDLLRQRQAWYQFHHLAPMGRLVWTERLELPTPGSRSRCAPIAPRPAVSRVVLTAGFEPALTAF